jgi:capsular polysaccharide biosynthesis protein
MADETDAATRVPPIGEGAFEPYFRSVRRHPLVFLTVMLVTLLCAAAWLKTRPVTYQASAQVLVTPAPYDDPTYLGMSILRDNPPAPIQVFETAAAMLNSPAAAAQTAQQLGRGWTAATVQSAITVVPFGESDIVTVQSTQPDARTAVRLVNLFTVASLQTVEHTFQQEATRVLAAEKAGSSQVSGSLQPQQVDSLQAVRHGVDPLFSLLHDAQSATAAGGDSSLRLVSLSLIPGLVFGAAAAFLTDAVMTRRRRRRELALLDDVPVNPDRELSAR